MYSKKMLSVLAILIVITILAGSFQKNTVNAQGTPSPASAKGSFPVSIIFTKAVFSMTPNSITLYGGTVIKLKPGMSIPAGIKPGILITVVAEVESNGFSAESIAIGTKPAPVTKVVATMQATAEAGETKEATLQATQPAETKEAQSDDCSGKTQNPVALRLSKVFFASYQDIVNLHCKSGYGFDDIARAYVVVQESRKPGAKPVTAAQVLSMHSSGQSWDDVKNAAGVKSDDLEKNSTLKDRDDDKKDDSNKSNTTQNGGSKNDSSKDSDHKDDGNKSDGSSDDDHNDDKGDDHNDDKGDDHKDSKS